LISYFQVDNPLTKVLDPLFLGLHAEAGAQMSAKALPKRDPLEKLGNFCLLDGRTAVIEYSDMPEDLARATEPDGRLRFRAGSIAIHIFNRDFVERLTRGGKCELPFHRALKKVPCIDAAGRPVSPSQPNAVKLEMFVFDAMPIAEKVLLLETSRVEEFSPVKNAEGADSLATCLRDQVRRWAEWLEIAGVRVPRDADGIVACPIEISPLFAADAADLAEKEKDLCVLALEPGKAVYIGE
jgi:UDP-N-acetylglucosamine/UDP-N-acetylgalactosamine diphosphorylase